MHFNPPGALTSDGWSSFYKEFKEKAPIRYWIQNDFRRSTTLPIKWKYDAVSDWIRYRTYDKYHVIKLDVNPGYYGYDSQILYANFAILKEYVETGLAWRSYWSEENRDKDYWKRDHIPFYNYMFPLVRPDLGIKHLEWEMTLDDPSLPPHERSPEQAKRAREVYALYKWWTETRPGRKELEVRRPPGDDDDILSMFSTKVRNTPEYKRYMTDLDKLNKQEEKWHKEDDAMLIRLMKIRRGLWT